MIEFKLNIGFCARFYETKDYFISPDLARTSELFTVSSWGGAPEPAPRPNPEPELGDAPNPADEPKKAGKMIIHLSDKASRSITVLNQTIFLDIDGKIFKTQELNQHLCG
jgi:hypothetical protein